MIDDLYINSLYQNNLDTKKFSRMLDSNSQSYKFYWLEAIISLALCNDGELSFDDIINEMICEAWYTVTEYHLKLGPTINGKSENFLERAINTLYKNCNIPEKAAKEEIINSIKSNKNLIKEEKNRLTDYVPYKLLYPFLDEQGLNYLKKDQHTRLIAYLKSFRTTLNPFYTIIDGRGLNKKIYIDDNWKNLIYDHYSVIKSWIQYRKVMYLQDRNPGVPGIIYKLEPETDNTRKLKRARELWIASAKIRNEPIKDIYTGFDLSFDNFDLDHFIPRSYIANDELWNLTPMDSNLNSCKNNRLPNWELFFIDFATYQFHLYESIFLTSDNGNIRELFEKCRKDNINSIWASESLYIEGYNIDSFINVLSKYLKPIYDSANMQGYELWNYSKNNVTI